MIYMPCEYCGGTGTRECRGQMECCGCGAPSKISAGLLYGKPVSFEEFGGLEHVTHFKNYKDDYPFASS
jgi:hypothetical protein